MVKRIMLLMSFALVISLAALPLSAEAQPGLEEVRASTAQGVAWLASQQNTDGSWADSDKCSITALAVKKVMHHAVDPIYGLGLPSPFDDGYAYKENVESGLNYIFEYCATIVTIEPQPAGDPDSDGDGIGVVFNHGHYTGSHENYATGITLMAICEAVDLDRVVEVGPLVGWTYEEVARDAMDYLAFGQNESNYLPPPAQGGWGYYANDTWNDNSNSGYVALGLSFAEALPPEGCGFTVPQFVKDELNMWINAIQDPVNGDTDDGGSWYRTWWSWVNILKTGNLLQQMAFVGDTESTPRVQDALDYMERHWNDPNDDPGWKGPPVNYQATFTTMKGMKSLGIETFGTTPIDWQADFETAILAAQNDDGSWYPCIWGTPVTPVLCTTWALLTLQKAAPEIIREVPFDIKPGSCPNPLNVKSKGVLPAAIMGTEHFDVTRIDPDSLQLGLKDYDEDGGVPRLRWAYADVGAPFEPFVGKEDCDLDCEGCSCPDGYTDLLLNFDTQELVAYLEAADEIADGYCLVLTITGNLKDEFGGTPIVGEDVLLILKKGKQ